jgi:hypothetical protein
VAVRQMDGMDMGVVTELGSFTFFVGAWMALMLPGAIRPPCVSLGQAVGPSAVPGLT